MLAAMRPTILGLATLLAMATGCTIVHEGQQQPAQQPPPPAQPAGQPAQAQPAPAPAPQPQPQPQPQPTQPSQPGPGGVDVACVQSCAQQAQASGMPPQQIMTTCQAQCAGK